jgi:putative nucleotidyltransferase-like protein
MPLPAPSSVRSPRSGGARPPPVRDPRREERLLLWAARIPRDEEGSGEPEDLLWESLDWPALLDKAFRHGVAPLLFFRLNSLRSSPAPRDAMDRLRSHFDANLRRNLFLAGELYRTLEVLKDHGVMAVPFRGVALAARAYRSLALRQFTDLDLLVSKLDVPQAADVLRWLGFRPQIDLPGKTLQRLLESESEILFSGRNDRVFVDLHWETSPRYFGFRQSPQRLLARLDQAAPPGCPAPALSAEDTLLLLASHGTRHLWERLIWISDLGRWIESHPALEWDRVLSEARALGGRRLLAVALRLAADLGGADVPPEVQGRMAADLRVPALVDWIRERLFQRAGPPDPRERFAFHVAVRERGRDRLRYFLRLAAARPPRRGRQLPRLPAFLAPFHFMGRALALLWKYFPGSSLRRRSR